MDAGCKTTLDMAELSGDPHGAAYCPIGEGVSDLGERTTAWIQRDQCDECCHLLALTISFRLVGFRVTITADQAREVLFEWVRRACQVAELR